MLGRFGVALFCTSLCSAAVIHIEVTRGAGLNNRAGLRGASLVVRVTDDAGKSVGGALVIFTAPSSGPSLDFGSGASVQISSDESGNASTPPARPAGGNGPVNITVFAAKNGIVANAVVSEMNVGEPLRENANDMEIAVLPEVKPARGLGEKRIVRVRVTDPSGKAVAGAKVTLRLDMAKNTVLTLLSQSKVDGVAEFQLDAKLLKGLSEVPVTAVAHEVTATRMIAIGPIAP